MKKTKTKKVIKAKPKTKPKASTKAQKIAKTKPKVKSKSAPKPKDQPKANLLQELMQQKIDALKSGEKQEAFKKFKPNKPRNENRSNVGPAWGPRKGN